MPYMRPPLSKDIWYTDDDELIQKHSFKQWNGKEKRSINEQRKRGFFFFNSKFFLLIFSLYFFDDEFYVDPKTLNEQENGGVAVVLGRKVTRRKRSVFFSFQRRIFSGRRTRFEKFNGQIGQRLGNFV